MLKSIFRKIAYVAATLVILIAILVCVTRLLTPVVDQRKAEIEKMASELLQMPVTIKSVKLSWRQYQPQINLINVTIYNKTTHAPELAVAQVNVFFSIWHSILQHTFVPSGIMLSGTDLTFKQAANGEFTLQGFPELNTPANSQTKVSDVVAWLAQQPYLILHNIDLHYVDKNQQKYFVSLYNLAIANAGQHHAIQGKAVLHQDIPTEVQMELSANGDVANFQQMDARGYLYVTGFSLSQWFAKYTWQKWQIKQGLLSAKVWAEWNHGALQRVQSDLQTYQMELFSQTDKSTHQFNRLSGNLGWKREGNKQIIAGDDILIDLTSHLWPATSFYLELTTNAAGKLTPSSVNIGYLDIADVQALLLASPPLLSESIRKNLIDLKLKGNLQDTAMTFPINYTDWQQITFATSFNQLSFASLQHYPHLNNLSGKISWDGKQGRLSLDSNHGEFFYDAMFPGAINIDQLSGDLQWKFNGTENKTLTVTIAALQVLNSDIAFNLHGNVILPTKAAPIANLNANFTIPQVSHITRYLPMRVLSPGLVGWLQEAFLAGEVKSGTATLRGSFVDFPFDKGNGLFTVSGELNNIDLRYATEWPSLQHIMGKLTYTGRTMNIDIDHLETGNIHATNVHGVIPDFGTNKPSILTVQSDIAADFTEAMHFIHSSPLEKSLGKMFSNVELHGPMQLRLGLIEPLSNPDAIKVKGDLSIKNTDMVLMPWNLTLSNINGQLQFTESTTTAQNIQAQLFNQPFEFSLATVQKNKNISVIRANFKNNVAILDLEKFLQLPLSKYASGSAAVNGVVDLSMQEPIELTLKSDLVGVALNFPGTFQKPANVAKDASLQFIMRSQQPIKLKLNYANQLSAAAMLTKKNDKYAIQSAELRLGKGQANWPDQPGIFLNGDFDVLDWDQVKTYLAQYSGGQSTQIKIRDIDVHANKLILFGQTIKQVDVQVIPSAKTYDVTISSDDIDGKISVPVSLNRFSTITANFDKLNLALSNKQQSVFKVDVKTLPSLDFTARDLSVNDIELGRVDLKTTPIPNGISIQSLRIRSSLLDMQSTGSWTKGINEVTKIQGSASSAKVSELLNSFGFDVRNFVASDGRLDFDLNWNKAPYDFSLANLNGNAKLNLASGRIVDIGQENGAKMGLAQLLSIFSLQTIPRRLTFDFSDVLHKGYSFDTLRGDFSLRNGDAYTNDFQIVGPIAKVAINGRIGLKNRDYNFTLIITPVVASSLPVAATATFLTGNPLIGLGAFAVNTVLGPSVSKATTYYYSVTGTWSNPIWKSINVNK